MNVNPRKARTHKTLSVFGCGKGWGFLCSKTRRRALTRDCPSQTIARAWPSQRGRLGKNVVKFAVLVAVLGMILYQVLPIGVNRAQAVGTTKYAVNAGGNWSADATWSTVAAKDASRVADTVKPTAEDTVILDDYSGSVTVDNTSALAGSVNLTGYTNTLTLDTSNKLTVSGNVTLAAGRVISNTGSTLVINATGTLISAGNTLENLTTAVGTITLGDASNVRSYMSLSSGTLITDGGAGSLTHNWGLFYSTGTGTRTLTLGNSTVNILYAAGGTAWQMMNTTNLTLNANTSTINFTNLSGTMAVATTGGTGKTFNIVNFTGGATPTLNASGSTFGTLTRTASAVKTDGLKISADIAVTGTLSLAGNNATNRLLVQTDVIGTPHTITVTGANLAGTDNVDFMDITFANGGSNVDFSAKSVGDCGGNTISGGGTLSFTAAAPQTWTNAAGGHWYDSGNWTSRVPLPQDDVWLGGLNGTGFAYNSAVTVTADMPRLGKSIDWTGATWTGTATTFVVGLGNVNMYGSLTLKTGMSWGAGSNTLQFSGRSNHTITTNTVSITQPFKINTPTGTYTLGGALSMTTNLDVTAGNFVSAGYSITTLVGFSSIGSITRSVDITNSLVTITSGLVGYGWNVVDTGLTLTTTGSTISLTYTGATNTTFAGGTKTYNNITISNGSGVLTFSGAFTFANMTMSSAGAKTVKFTKNTTYTMTGSSFLNGTAGNLVTIDSDDGATAFTMTKASGTVTVDYVAKSRMQVTGATWYSTANSTPYPDPNVAGSGNTGWTASGAGNIRTISAAGGNWSTVGAWNEGIVPTASDNVFAAPASGNITIDNASAVANSANFTNYVGTMTQTGTNTLTLSGSLTLVAGMTYTPASTSFVVFNSTAAGNTVTSGGKTLGNVTFNGAGGVWTLADNLTANNFTLTAGTFNASTFNVTCVNMTASGAVTRVLQYGTGNTWTVSGNWDSSGTNQTETPGTSTVDLTGTGSVATKNVSAGDFYTLKCAHDTKTTTGTTGFQIINLLYVYSGGILSPINVVIVLQNSTTDPLINTGATFTGGGWFKYTPNANLTVAGYNFGNLGLEYVAIANSVTITLSSGITTTGSIYMGANTSGKTGTLDTAGFNIACGNLFVGLSGSYGGVILFKNGAHTITGVIQRQNSDATNAIDFGTGSISVGGNINFTGITVTPGTGTQTTTVTNTSTITSYNGTSTQHFNNLTVNAAGKTVVLASDLIANGDFTLTAGTFNASTFNVTCVNMTASGATTRVLQYGTGNTWTVSGNWDSSGTNITETYGTSTVDLTGTGSVKASMATSGWRSTNPDFYNLKCAHNGQTTSLASAIGVAKTFYVYSGGILSGGTVVFNGTGDQLVNTGATFNGGGALSYRSGGGTVAGYDFGNWNIYYINGNGTATYSLSSDVTTIGNILVGNQYGPNHTTLDTNGHNLSCANLSTSDGYAGPYGIILLRGGSHTVTGNLTRSGLSGGNIDFGTGSISVGGNIDFTGITVTAGTGSQTVTMNATTTGKTITSAGQSFNNITFNGAGGGWTLADALVANGDFNLIAGTFNASTFNVNCVNMTASGSTTRVLQLGTGNLWTVSGSWNSSGTNITLTNGTSTVDLTETGGLTTAAGGTDFYNLKCAHDGKITTIYSSIYAVSHLFYVYSGGTLASSGTRAVYLSQTTDPLVNTGASFTGTGIIRYTTNNVNITLAGYNFGSWGIQYYLNSNTNRTATLSSDLTTTGNITIGDNNTSYVITLDTNGHNLSCANLYAGTSSYGGGAVLLKGGSHTVTGNISRSTSTLTTNAIDFGTGSISVGGNIDFTGITVTPGTGTQTVTMNGSAQQNITSAGAHFNNLTIANTHANGVRPVDTLAVNGNLTVQADGAGAVTLDNANNVAIGVTGNLSTAGAGAGAKNIKMGTNTWTVGGNVDFTGGTITKSTSTLDLNSSTAGQTLTSASNSLNNLTVANTNASGVTFADGATATGTFTDTTASSKLTFNDGSAYAFTNVSLNGQADGTRIRMLSSTPGSEWFFNVSDSQAVSRVDVADSNAAGGLTITDATGSNHDSGGNTNWDFVYPTNPTTTNATVGGTAITSGTWTNLSGAFNFTFSGAANGGVGTIGYYVYLGTNASADPVADGTYQAHSGAIGDPQYYNSTIAASDDGKHYYFIVKTKNNADNTPDAATLYDLGYDITLPTRPSFVAANPAGYTTVNLFTFSWPAGSDPNGPNGGASGIKWYEYKRATDGAWSHTADANDRSIAGITAYQEGANAFYVRTIDNAGNTGDYQQVTYYWSGVAPAKPDNLTVTPGTSDTNLFTISWHKPVQGVGESPIVGYYYSINVYPTNTNTTYVASQADTVTIGPDAYASQQGLNTVYVLSVNAAGGRSFESAFVASATFNCQTPAMPIPTSVSLYDSSDRNLNRWMLTLQWVAGTGQDPSTFSHYIIYRSTDGLGYTQLATTTSTAYIDASGLNNSTTYYYNIKAVDNAGQESAQSTTVSKMPTGNYTTPPALLSGPAATDIKVTSAKITWITDRVSSSIVRYGTQNGTFSASSGQFDSVTNHSVTLSGLAPATAYYYQTQSLDENRDYSLEDAYSTTFSLTTLPAPAISSVKVTNITLSNADISWDTTTVAHSTLYYGQTNAYGSSLDDQSGSGTTTHNVKLQSLTAGTTYHFKISGTDSDGNVLTSDDYQFDTLPLPQIENLKIEPIFDKPQPGFKASWTTNVPTSTTLKYRLSSEAQTLEQTTTKMETAHEVIVEGLLDNSVYLIVAEGRDSLGNLAQSGTQSFQTPLDTRPPVISDVTVETSNVGLGKEDKAQIAVSWTTDEGATSQVEYSEGLSGDQYAKQTVEDKGLNTDHLVIISNLTPSIPYHLRVISADKGNNVAKSDDTIAITSAVQKSILQLILQMLRNIFGWMGI